MPAWLVRLFSATKTYIGGLRSARRLLHLRDGPATVNRRLHRQHGGPSSALQRIWKGRGGERHDLCVLVTRRRRTSCRTSGLVRRVRAGSTQGNVADEVSKHHERLKLRGGLYLPLHHFHEFWHAWFFHRWFSWLLTFDNVFMRLRLVSSQGSRLSAPTCKDRRYGLSKTLISTCLLILVQPGCMVWIFEYVATYAKACSLLPPREPSSWSWTCRPAAFGAEEACCALRQAHAVALSSGEPLLLSCCRDWPGISVLTKQCSALGNCWRELRLSVCEDFQRVWQG